MGGQACGSHEAEDDEKEEPMLSVLSFRSVLLPGAVVALAHFALPLSDVTLSTTTVLPAPLSRKVHAYLQHKIIATKGILSPPIFTCLYVCSLFCKSIKMYLKC